MKKCAADSKRPESCKTTKLRLRCYISLSFVFDALPMYIFVVFFFLSLRIAEYFREMQGLMRRSTRNFNIPPTAGKSRTFELLKIGSFKFPLPSGQNGIQMLYPIVGFVCQMPLLKNNRRAQKIVKHPGFVRGVGGEC